MFNTKKEKRIPFIFKCNDTEVLDTPEAVVLVPTHLISNFNGSLGCATLFSEKSLKNGSRALIELDIYYMSKCPSNDEAYDLLLDDELQIDDSPEYDSLTLDDINFDQDGDIITSQSLNLMYDCQDLHDYFRPYPTVDPVRISLNAYTVFNGRLFKFILTASPQSRLKEFEDLASVNWLKGYVKTFIRPRKKLSVN
jgi:hypothetical protein